MRPPAPRKSRFAPGDELRGPLSTIPDGLQLRMGEGDLSMEATCMPKGPETDANSLPSWDEYFDHSRDVRVEERDTTFRVYEAGNGGPVVFCLHGGGYTAMSWACLAAKIKARCQVVAFDARGHGQTVGSNCHDLSAETLVQDALSLWSELYRDKEQPHVLIGHSMGGAIAARLGSSGKLKGLEGVVVIDVVEGTALAALPKMQTILNNRPASFPSLRAALSWAQSSGMSKNPEAAAISIPSMLEKQTAVDRQRWVWRTNLALSQPFWRGWYTGLSDLFLQVKSPKLLMLAGTDRLDKALTIGQMQGKFQLSLLTQAGHAVHEDESEKVANVLTSFLARYQIGKDKNLPKWPIPKTETGLQDP